ncbi:MAG: c-type cytochrome [Myxococcales bacterium]|nr:c-type cytochrome [Myxococcales bacterium]MCB9626267.1 c-type cytochrome [Sandaracinaceae bacterium]
MKRALKVVGVVALLLVVAGGGLFGWASLTVSASLGRTLTAHEVDIPVPFPLSEAELSALRQERLAERAAAGEPSPDATGAEADVLAGVDLDALALERAIERGRHLVGARYACGECHGREDFSGGVMVDDPAMGSLLGPNLTPAGPTRDFDVSDWDHIVRHGILPDGRPAMMPSEDFVRMSDRELSDIIAFLRAQPPVENEVAASRLGPVGTLLAAFGKLPLSADLLTDHQAAHIVEPPATEPTAEFGRHLVAICTGCHRANLEGGPIAAGPPDWLPAANLTPHADGLAGWTFEDFDAALRRGVRPDGSALRPPMTIVQPYAQAMTETERRALWAYLETVAPQPQGE